MKELENLLTSLVERGRKPFWKERCFKVESVDKNTYEVNCGNIWYRCSLRDLVSLESGLWHFVCERDMKKEVWKARAKEPSIVALRLNFEDLALSFEPEYRLIESALIPEEELAKFLVDNIKVEWPGKN